METLKENHVVEYTPHSRVTTAVSEIWALKIKSTKHHNWLKLGLIYICYLTFPVDFSLNWLSACSSWEYWWFSTDEALSMLFNKNSRPAQAQSACPNQPDRPDRHTRTSNQSLYLTQLSAQRWGTLLFSFPVFAVEPSLGAEAEKAVPFYLLSSSVGGKFHICNPYLLVVWYN